MDLRRLMVILTIVMVIILAVLVWFFPSDKDFRVENPFWNGTEEINSSYRISPLDSLSNLPSSPQGSTLVLIPYIQFTPDELGALNKFTTGGGNLVLADDYGYGNQVLEYLGLKTRFSARPLLDPLSNYKNRRFPWISHIIPSTITNDIDNLVFNHATALTDVETGDALALASSFSFLDLSGDQKWQEGEPTGPLPVISRQSLGNGQVILISDPSLFINSMEGMADNDNLMRNIAAITTSSLFMDQSHLPPSNLHQTKGLLTQIFNLLITPAGTLGLVVLVLTVTLMPLWRERRQQ